MEKFTVSIAEKKTGNLMTYTGDKESVQKFAAYYKASSRKDLYNVGAITPAGIFV